MIIGPALVVSGGLEPRIIADGGVRVAGSHIAQVGPIGPLASAFPEETVWPAGGRLLLPGLVNGHAHLARHLARGLGLEHPADWERYDRALAPEDVRCAARAALVEGVRHGITTTCDLHRSGTFVDFSLSEVAEAARQLGVRVATAYAADEDDSADQRRAAIDESLGLVAELRRQRQGRVQALLGMRARTPAGLARFLDDMDDHAAASVGVHVELAGATQAERWLDRRIERQSLWAHVEHAWSGLQGGLERAPALPVEGPGAPHAHEPMVAWGSDSGVNSPPALERTGGPGTTRRHYHQVMTSGARWAEHVFGEGLGVIEPGAPADLILVDYYPATDLEQTTVFEHLAACLGRSAVSGAMVSGDIVMDRGVLVTVDESEVAARARECARRLWRRL
ncbi:MAG TPA: amidohydrolase family protein [Candidatus Eisenbacteria bacterium]|nr:amidohydrolase family protein [Candidatus Eisenbacteria bacterium]